ncbi:hypothetical protein OWR29_10190 [Actinoplanes sp. Pm04-4]|uniref:Lipoprotein n=1 Tax=Paractinoplanes pyxinae TaxID=2997416 RepID=A0ABT4AVV8_9ACTN|nr:hypothetical protein [Actinoplanes pyxinae]MCY1138365.1 hypothetical protein [Actinoplanes pyxinae]
MTHKRWRAALLVPLLAACSAEPPTPPTAAPAASPTAPGSAAPASPATPSSAGSDVVDCAHDIGGRPPDSGYRLVLDAVALPTGVLQANDSGEPGRLFAKTGLLVRAGRAVELTVTTPGVTIGWGSPGPEGTTIRVPACPNPNGWLAFAGGYTVTEPTCVALTVRSNGREQKAEVSVGRRC